MVCRTEVMGGEGAPCLHFVWNEEQAKGSVKDTKEGQMCFSFLHVRLFTYLCMWICMNMCVCI